MSQRDSAFPQVLTPCYDNYSYVKPEDYSAGGVNKREFLEMQIIAQLATTDRNPQQVVKRA